MAPNQISRLVHLAQAACDGQIDIAAATAMMIRESAAVEADPYRMIGVLIEAVVYTICMTIPPGRWIEVTTAALQLLAERAVAEKLI
jgi:hypothetical protein